MDYVKNCNLTQVKQLAKNPHAFSNKEEAQMTNGMDK